MKRTFIPRGKEWISTNQIDSVWEFIKAVDWSEHWLISLIAFHAITFLCIVGTRRYTNFQVVLFLCLLGLAFASEQVNILGAKYWRTFAQEQYFDSHGLFITEVVCDICLANNISKTFAQEQYFDSHGLFITVVYSGPILFNCFVLTVLWLWTAGKMLIVVKRGQLKEKRKKEAEDKKVD